MIWIAALFFIGSCQSFVYPEFRSGEEFPLNVSNCRGFYRDSTSRLIRTTRASLSDFDSFLKPIETMLGSSAPFNSPFVARQFPKCQIPGKNFTGEWKNVNDLLAFRDFLHKSQSRIVFRLIIIRQNIEDLKRRGNCQI